MFSGLSVACLSPEGLFQSLIVGTGLDFEPNLDPALNLGTVPPFAPLPDLNLGTVMGQNSDFDPSPELGRPPCLMASRWDTIWSLGMGTRSGNFAPSIKPIPDLNLGTVLDPKAMLAVPSKWEPIWSLGMGIWRGSLAPSLNPIPDLNLGPNPDFVPAPVLTRIWGTVCCFETFLDLRFGTVLILGTVLSFPLVLDPLGDLNWGTEVCPKPGFDPFPLLTLILGTLFPPLFDPCFDLILGTVLVPNPDFDPVPLLTLIFGAVPLLFDPLFDLIFGAVLVSNPDFDPFPVLVLIFGTVLEPAPVLVPAPVLALMVGLVLLRIRGLL